MNKKCSKGINRREFIRMTAAGSLAFGLGIAGFPAVVHSRNRMRVGYIPILDHLLLGVSHEYDNVSFKHIDIEPVKFKRWDEVAGALNSGALDGAFLLSNFAMDLFDSGSNIKTILIGHRHGSGISVARDSVIRSAADLKGKNIAVPARISTHVALLESYLRGAALTIRDVNTSVVDPPNMVNALKSGSIDAFIVAEPFVAKAELEGTGRTLILSKDIILNHICCVVVVRNEVLKGNPEGIQEWVDSLIKSGRFVEKDKVASRSRTVAPIGSKYLGHNESLIIEVLQHPKDRITYADLNPRKSDFQTILGLSVKAGVLGDVDLDRFIDGSFYKRSKGAA